LRCTIFFKSPRDLSKTLTRNVKRIYIIHWKKNYAIKIRMVERFINDAEKQESTNNILIGLGTSILMIVLLSLMIWSYYYDLSGNLFTIVISSLFLIYSILNMIYVSLNSESLSIDYFNVVFGSSIYMVIISFGVFVLYCLKFFKIA